VVQGPVVNQLIDLQDHLVAFTEKTAVAVDDDLVVGHLMEMI
jgi:hypothetical protein